MNKFLKVLVIALCAVLLVAGSVTATLAYLTMKTASVQNTFTAGDITITLKQTEDLNAYQMMPGMVYAVNPVVTVEQDSEKCWLFIKIDKPAGFDTYLTYSLVEGWEELESGVYYREVAATTAKAEFHVIEGDQVKANADRTKDDYKALSGPLNLNFTAYAVQYVGFDNAAAAWAEAQKLDTTTETETETAPPEIKG